MNTTRWFLLVTTALGALAALSQLWTGWWGHDFTLVLLLTSIVSTAIWGWNA